MTQEKSIAQRKAEHLRIAAKPESHFRQKTTLLEEVDFVHCALPELSLAEIDLSVELCGKRLAAPLYFSGMTGGTDEAREINKALARVAERHQIAFGLGSQRPMLRDPKWRSTYEVRDVAPSMLLFSNIGAVQAAASPTAQIKSLVDDVGADALCIHLNPAQELTQGEGDRDFHGCLDAIQRLCAELGVPVIVKEVGAGLSPFVASQLISLGVSVVDVAGAGGTSWVGIEAQRGGIEDATLGEELWDWGIPTAAALLTISPLGVPVLSSGGIKTGMDVARSVALGARAVGIAGEALRAYLRGGESAVDELIAHIVRTLRAVSVMTRSRNMEELARTPKLLGPRLSAWEKALQVQSRHSIFT
jgi:isopentenyl-diphosphate delta-isomerase